MHTHRVTNYLNTDTPRTDITYIDTTHQRIYTQTQILYRHTQTHPQIQHTSTYVTLTQINHV